MIHPAMACNPCKHGICEYEGDCETCIAQGRVRELEAEVEHWRLRSYEHETRHRTAEDSCNHIKRIRELEAELASMEPTVLRDLLARAEKAERLLAAAEEIASEEQREHIADYNALIAERDLVKLSEERLKARVAELEGWLRKRFEGHRFLKDLRIEAREREAE